LVTTTKEVFAMKEKKVEKTTRTKLAELEAERLTLQTAERAARKAMARLERELVTAEGNLAVATATAASGSWLDRRELRKAEAAVADVRAKLDGARAQAREAEAALDPIEDSIIELQVGAHGPEIRAARKKAAELKALLREQQEAALVTARQMAAIYKAAAAKIPRRLVSMRSEKFLRVEITDPAITALYGEGSFTNVNVKERQFIQENADSMIGPIEAAIPHMDPKAAAEAKNQIASIRKKALASLEKTNAAVPKSVFLHFEFFKARDGEKRGKWKIVPGQDMNPGKVERIYEDGALPGELAAIMDIELGRLTRLNGRAATDLEKTELDFNFLLHSITDEEMREAVQIIEEGA
jgi:chromosome segregation ATPase